MEAAGGKCEGKWRECLPEFGRFPVCRCVGEMIKIKVERLSIFQTRILMIYITFTKSLYLIILFFF